MKDTLTKVNSLQKNPKVLTRIIDSNAVAIFLSDDYDDSLRREVYIFNKTGTKIWELIDGKNNIVDIAEKIYSEYELPLEHANKCVKEMVDRLAKAMLINISAEERKNEKQSQN